MAADDHNVPNPKHGKTTATGAVSPNATKKPKDRVPVKPDLTEINQYLMCPLCSGYFIDATAIIECQHTFCKSCILKYLETNSYCPICDVQLNNAKPHMSLRSDVIVQRLVYKLVPGSLVSELRRRRDFELLKCDSDKIEAAEMVSNGMALEVEAATDLSTIISLEDVVSLSIEYFRSCDGENTVPKEQLVHQKQEQQPTTNAQDFQDIKTSACSHEEANDRRYLQCPAAVSVGLLKKFIRMKYGLSDDYRVDLLYNGDRDTILENDLTLLDVAFIFKWNKDEPMRFHYRIFDRTAKSIVARPGTKRSHPPSMMDEPPDDDAAASGPHNRSSMTSTSPSSKLPRLSGNSTGANSNAGSTGKSSSRTTSTSASATLAYDFCEEGNPAENDKMKKGKYRGIHRKNSSSNNTNSINNLSKTGSQGLKRSPSSLRSHLARSQSQSGEAGKAFEAGNTGNANRRSMSTNTSGSRIGRSNSVGNSGKDIKTEEGDSDSHEGVGSDGSKNSDSTVTNSNRLRSASQQVIQSQQMNGSLKFSISTALGDSNASVEKREPLKLSLGPISSKSPERKHKHKHHKLKHKEKSKSLKFTFPTNQNVNQSNSNQSMNQNQNHKSSGKELKPSIGKAQQSSDFGNKKAVDGKGNGNVSGGSNNNSQNNSNVPNSVKTSTSTHLSNMSKSISVSIGVNMQGSNNMSGNNMMNSSSGQNSNKGNQYGNKNITPSGLLPKNTGIEIQSTLSHSQNLNSHSTMGNNHQSASRSHPLLPDSVHVPKSVTLIPVNPNAMSNPGSVVPGRGNSSGNPPEKSGSGTSNRLNAHTFTHPITNKSLHQITVTEVPPPPKSGRSSPANTNSTGGNSSSANAGNNSSNTGSGCNPIEKVIANAVANKPQFNGPGSMEITKIYCGSKETPTKKLKERKGLDISISVPGMNVNMKDKCKSTLEETLRQKMGMGNSATSLTLNNKVKGVSQTPTTLINAKMPPGITIGPVAGMNKSSLNTPSNQQNTNTGNTIKGLGFTLPPHITAHPQLPPGGMRNIPATPVKPTEKNTNRNSTKELTVPNSNNRINPTSTPEPMVNGKSNNAKGQMNQIQSRKQLGEALASMFDMASRNVMKSPSPPKSSQSKDKGPMPSSFTSSQSNRDGSSSNCDKRPLDMSSSSRKNSRESPEPKRPRGIESSGSKTSSSNETPLDLSGRSSRPSSASSNSSSPGLGSSKSNNSSPTEKPKISEPYHSANLNNNTKRTPTPVPKVSPPTLSNSGGFSSSPNAKLNQDSTLKNSMKSLVSPSAGTQTASPSILSIAQSLAQKQLQQQQQQNLHNQIMQLHQGLHSMHSNPNPSNQGKPGSLGTGLKGIGNTGGHNNGNMTIPGSSVSNSMGLSSLSPPIIPMPNPSPPGTSFDPLRNLLTLSDVALRHGKLHPMNNLMAAAGLCPPPPHSHAMSLAGSPSAVTTAGLFSHLPQHLVNSLAASKSAGILDPGSHAHLYGNLAALSAAHNERLAAVAGMNHHFGGSLSPPLSLTNSFYSQQIRPPSSSPHGSLRIPTVTPKSNSSNNSKKGSTPPLSFSHPPPHSSNNSSTKSLTSPPTSNPTVFSSSSNSPITNVTYSSKSSDSSSTASKNVKINGSLSNTFPLLPPGIHNPLMPTNRPLPSMNASSTGNKGSITNSSGMNMNTKVTNSDKKGIPNSMKISNFLPSKPKDRKAGDSNVEATITSGSNVGGTSLTKFLNSIPPLIVSQSQPNLSMSSPPKDSPSRLPHSPTKLSTAQECMNVFTSSSIMQSSTGTSNSDNIDTNSKSSLMNSIKHEPESSSNAACSRTTISSKNDPIPQIKTMISPTPNATSEASSTKNIVKSNSSEIKSEEGGLASESCSGRATATGHSTVGILGLSNLSPPLSSGRATQPQNRAVRHIPNPSLLFNRQNSNGCNQIASLIAPSSTTNTNASSPVKSSLEENNSNPFIQKSPIKLDELPLQVPALLFPGVSVPVQVKVVNEDLAIPISIINPINLNSEIVDTKPLVIPVPETSHDHAIATGNHDNEMSPIKSINKAVEAQAEILEVSKELGGNAIPKSDVSVSKQLAPENETKLNSNSNLISGGVHQIIEKESLEDAEQDIDVGTEMGPIFSPEYPTENIKAEEQPIHQDAVKVEISQETAKNEDASVSSDNSPNEEFSLMNEVKEEKVDQDQIDEIESVVVNAIKTIVSVEETKAEIKSEVIEALPQQEIFDYDQMEIDTEAEAVDVTLNANIESKNVSEGEGNQDGTAVEPEAEVDVGIDEPMEVNVEELLEEPLDNEMEEKVQPDDIPMESSSGENPDMEMEIVEAVEVLGEVDSIIPDKAYLIVDADIPMENQTSDDTVIEQDLKDLPLELMDNMTENELVKLEAPSANVIISQEDCPLVAISTVNATTDSTESVENVEMAEVNVPKVDEEIVRISSPLLAKEVEAEELIEKELPAPSEEVIEFAVEGAKISISNTDLNSIPTQILLDPRPEAIQVQQETAENNTSVVLEPVDETAECKESPTESINALDKAEAVEAVKSSTELEVDCPPVATGIETITKGISNAPHTEAPLEDIILITDGKEESETVLEVVCQNPSIVSITEAQGEDTSQNIINAEDNRMDLILTEEKVEEAPTEACLSVSDPHATSDSHDNSSISDEASADLPESEQERPKVSMELISATATITTTTTSDISAKSTNTVEIEVGIAESPLSTSIPNSPLGSQKSQMIHSGNNLTNMETLEKVAAGFLASAASSINNNNNTSLSTMATSTCDITITTTHN